MSPAQAPQAKSWHDLVETKLVGEGLKAGAIIGRSDGAVWGASSNLSIDASETPLLTDLLDRPDPNKINEFTLGGERYRIEASEPDQSVFGVSGSSGSETAKGGYLLKSDKAIVVGIWDASQGSSEAVATVKKVVSLLRSNGF